VRFDVIKFALAAWLNTPSAALTLVDAGVFEIHHDFEQSRDDPDF
jgi:hypothetical protein